jgi:8-oxo-dGTP pyrophosphatase MutT (NUDIX family)
MKQASAAAAQPASTAPRPAAVLVPLYVREQELWTFFTKRTDAVEHHKGQISFPGGRQEESDTDSVEAALRESEEEVGLPRDHVEVIGRLDTYITGTGFEIAPVVGLVRVPFPERLDAPRVG